MQEKILIWLYNSSWGKLFFIAAALLVIYFIIQYAPQNINNKQRKTMNIVSLAIWLICVSWITLFMRGASERTIEFMPGQAYYKAVYLGSHDDKQLILLNILMFVPGGLFLEGLSNSANKHHALINLMCLMLFSAVIEAMQYIFKLGTAETDDVINNTLGAGAGIAINMIFERIKKNKTDRRKRA